MIYLFDKDEKLIKIVRKSAVKTALQKYALTTERYVSDRLTVELKGLNADELEQVEYMAIQTMEDAHIFHYFYVAQKSSDELTTLIGVQSGIEELRKSPIYDKRPQNALARDVITDLLAGTNWQARFVGETTAHSTNFYYTSVFDALKKVCEVWDLEMQFFVEMNGNRIGARNIDFKRRIGEAVGKRVVYGHNALQILQEVERTNIFTALIGRGKGEETGDGYGRKITFENVVWSTTQGNPVNKPAGQKYLELPLMTREYGIKNADGSMRPKIGFVDFSEEANPEVLIERTYKALIDAARPQLTLKTSSVYLKGVKVGDTIRVVRHDKKLDYDTRIFEITFNRLNNQSSDIKLGDRIGESNEAKAQKIADKAVEQFVNNEFSNFVQNLPDYLPSADGFNNNWYGAEDPTVQYPGKVLINDIWYKPDPEHEGHKIMLRWSGEVWEEILRTYESEALRDRIAEEIAQVNASMRAQSEEHDRQVADILSQTQSVEELANQAKTDAVNAINGTLEAKQLAQTAGGQISQVQLAVDEANRQILQRVTKVEFNPITQRLSSAETTILTQAGLIEQRLTSTQVESAITSKGYITSSALQPYALATTVQNLVKETADSFSRTISETRALIPTDFSGGNLIRNGGFPTNTQYWYWSGQMIVSQHDFYYNGQKKLFLLYTDGTAEITALSNRFEVKRNTDYTLSFYAFAGSNVRNSDVWFLGRKSNETDDFTSASRIIDSRRFSNLKAEYVTVTFNSGNNDSGYIRFDNNGSTDGIHAVLFFGEVMLVEGTTPRKWEACLDDFVTEIKYNVVKDTVDSHTRTIGAVGTSGSILDNVSKVTQTAAGLVQEVSGTNGLKTQVSTLAGSWAVKNLTNSGTVLNQINLNKDGSIKIDGSLVQITGKTYIQDGVITSAKIADLDAGKITTGYLASARIATNSITGSHIAFDQAFFNNFMAKEAYLKQIFAKNAFITQVQTVTLSASQISSGIAKALNGGMDVNFDESKINFYTNVAAIRRIYTGHPTQFIKFETEGNYSRTIIGSNRNGGEVFNSATFAGIVTENTNNINTEDRVRIYGDSTLLRHAQGDVGWNINSVTQRIVPADMNAESEIWAKHFVAPDKNSKPVRLDTAVAALWDIWNHIIYNNFEFNEALRTHIRTRRDNWAFELNI
ncbi:phage tail spike protein [Streptococcus sp. VTCC 12905]|uniref:phage tail spike protein n=1 Tax=Streptococcus sp. VTCC 12905 TaxID=3413768 RepID=UPI003D9C7857